MKTKIKLIATICACSFAGINLTRAENFIIEADGVIITNTNTGQTTNNASAGYENIATSSTSAFIFGGTNTVRHFVNATVVGSSNQVTAGGGYMTGTNAGAFGANNSITTGNYGVFANVYAFGANNELSSSGLFGTTLASAYAIGGNNTIRNSLNNGYGTGNGVSNAFAVGDSNSIINEAMANGGINNAYIFGRNNNFANSINGGLTNFYAFGTGNNLSSGGGRFSNAYVVGINNSIKGEFNAGMSGAYMFGSDNKIYSTGTTSIGAAGNSGVTNAYTLGNNNSIISTGSNGNLASSFAIGSNNSITSAVGNFNVTDSYVIGSNNNIVAANRVVVAGIGNTVSASATNTFVIGNNINAINPNNVILGNSSADVVANPVSTVTIGGFAIAPAGANPVGVVSIGASGKERQITNVAAGRVTANSTDAINGSELYITNTTLSALAETVASLTPGSAGDALLWSTSSNAFVATHGGTNNKITGVLSGVVAANSSDAINGAQLHGTATSILNLFGTGSVNADGTITGGTFATGGTTINQAITNLYNNTISLTTDALIWSNTLNAYDASHGTGAAQRITNVANATINATSLDAINGRQLYGTANSIVNLLGTGTVNNDGTIAGGQFVINGGTFNNLTSLFTDLTQTINNIASGSATLVRQDIPTGNITIGAATSGTLINIAGTTGDRQLTGVAAGVADNDAVNVAQLKASGIISGTGADNTIANVLIYDSAVKNTVTLGGPAVTGTGAQQTGGTRITNLALAAINAASTDAVTGSQLFDTNQRVTNLESTVATLVSSATNAPTIAGSQHFSTGNDDTATPANAIGGNAVAAGMGATASGASSSAVGANAKARAAKSIAIGSLAETHAEGGLALGNNAVVVAAAINSVAIGANSIATEADTVSFGSDTYQRRLVNVADGINLHDAVNMRQLATFESAVNGRFDNLQNQVNAVSDRLDRVGAMSAAINQVQTPLVSDGRRSQLSLGVGGHRSHGAFAMGYSYISRLGDCGIRASFSLSDRADIMGGTGVIFAW